MRTLYTMLLLVILTGSVQAAKPGQSRFSSGNGIEYIVGNIPIIIAAPHGGRIKPENIPDRTTGTLVTDTNTDKLAKVTMEAFHKRTGKFPHVIICHIKRTKVDCNRGREEGAAGNKEAEKIWNDFHHFIEEAKTAIEKTGQPGFYIDLHAHGHPIPRLELGYALKNTQLRKTDTEVESLEKTSSINDLSRRSPASFAEILRGKSSLGALMQAHGFPSIPSPTIPDAGTGKYFNGGYNTRRYGSGNGGTLSSVQIESPYKGVRDSDKSRKAFADALADSVIKYMKIHTGISVLYQEPERMLN